MRRCLAIPFSLIFLTSCTASVLPPQEEQERDGGGNPKPNGIHEQQEHAQGKSGTTGKYQTDDFDPHTFLTTWNFNNLAQEERAKYYREKPLSNGTLLREYFFSSEDKEIEVAPGVFFPAWTFNGQVPGPTIRATEGDTIKVHLTNRGAKPHSMHFHGFHSADMDGATPDQALLPGESFTYEFKAEPFGTHLYHCHSFPISQHLSKGLYGAYIVDPRKDTRPKPDKEFVMVMNGFDVSLDGKNDIYAVNTRAFAYAEKPIEVKVGELVRIHLSNLLEFDLMNSFHLHANFFNQYKTGTKLEPDEFTDTIILGQGQRSILDLRFREPGMYMFHAHVTEFSELGWMGMFSVSE